MLKFIARKPVAKTDIYLKFGFVITEHEQHLCPRCKDVLDAGLNHQPRYCGQCGQKLSFSGIVWNEDKKLRFAKAGDGI